MNPFPLVLQAYTPQIHLGDWQIVIFVNRKRNLLSVERWHSSERPYERKEIRDQALRIQTGIRAFRRQMPYLAGALESVAVDSSPDEEIVETVFRILADVYGPDPMPIGTDERIEAGDLAEFLEERKREALAALNAVKH